MLCELLLLCDAWKAGVALDMRVGHGGVAHCESWRFWRGDAFNLRWFWFILDAFKFCDCGYERWLAVWYVLHRILVVFWSLLNAFVVVLWRVIEKCGLNRGREE